MNLSEFEGRQYGVVPWRVATDSVGDFIELTSDDPARWRDHAPPGFAAAALFAVAPELLAELYEHSVIHGEQTFHWNRPLETGTLLEVSGQVTRVRERGGVFFVTFEMNAVGEGADVLSGKSLFLASGESLAAGLSEYERQEPPHSYKGDPKDDQVAASRGDLVRYASSTRDWNPVHWDHEAGVAAGFAGVVVHGLLQAGWALRVASEHTRSARPFDDARFRFRKPLLPGRPADIVASMSDAGADVVIGDDDTEYLTATVKFADE